MAEITSLASYLVYFNVWRENLGVFHEIARVAGARKQWAQERKGTDYARPFFLAPITSKRPLRRLFMKVRGSFNGQQLAVV